LVTFYNTGFNILRDYYFLKQSISEELIKWKRKFFYY
jgi:hypothetical protein